MDYADSHSHWYIPSAVSNTLRDILVFRYHILPVFHHRLRFTMGNLQAPYRKAEVDRILDLPLHPDGHYRPSVHIANHQPPGTHIQDSPFHTVTEDIEDSKDHPVFRVAGNYPFCHQEAKENPLYRSFHGHFLYLYHSHDYVQCGRRY